MTIRQQVEESGLTLPQAPQPVGNYQATIRNGNLLYISGQLPLKNGELMYQGKLGLELTIEQGQSAARLCALNLLSQLDQALNGQTLKSLIKVEGYINATDAFMKHAAVLNGASDLFAQVLGEQAGHIRTVVGCTSLPMNAAIEISVIAEIH